MEELDFDLSKLTDGALRVVSRAEDEARRRGHGLLTSEHLFISFAQVEWALYARIMRDLSLNPDEVLTEVCSALASVPAGTTRTLKATELTQGLLRRALQAATAGGREQAEAYDVFGAILQEQHSGPCMILRRFGADADAVIERLTTVVRDVELRDEKLRKRYELPPFLKQFAVNLNLLARQDRLPPVFGRDKEQSTHTAHGTHARVDRRKVHELSVDGIAVGGMGPIRYTRRTQRARGDRSPIQATGVLRVLSAESKACKWRPGTWASDNSGWKDSPTSGLRRARKWGALQGAIITVEKTRHRLTTELDSRPEIARVHIRELARLPARPHTGHRGSLRSPMVEGGRSSPRQRRRGTHGDRSGREASGQLSI